MSPAANPTPKMADRFLSFITHRSRQSRPLGSLIVTFLAFFALYAFTLSPGLLPADSGEFQTVVPLLGVAHPPGFSLYILLGKLFTGLVRIGSYAYRLNLFSAFTSAITLALVTLVVQRLTRPTPHAPLLTNLPGFLAAFILGVSTTFWSQATTANIRSLMALLTALAVCALIEYQLNPTINRLAFLAFTLSLAVVHHLSIAFIAITLAAAAIVFTPSPRHLVTPKILLKLSVSIVAPLAVLLYLPIRGAAGAYLAPPGLNTLNGFLQHALGLGFGGDFFYFANLSALPDRLAILLNIFLFQFNAPTLILLAIGLLLFFFRDPKLAAALTLAFAVHCVVAITYRAPQTVEYLLPAYVILVITALSGWQFIFDRWPSRFEVWTLKFALYCSFFISSLLILFRNYPAYKTLSHDDSTRAHAEGLLLAAHPNALILANWHYATPLWYLQRIEGVRPDVTVEYVFPQGASLTQNWVDQINANAADRPTIVTNFYPTEYASLPHRFLPILTALPAWQAATDPLTDPIPAAPTHEGGWAFLSGGPISQSPLTQNESFTVQIFWQAPESPTDINFFVQLIGPDGLLYGQADVFHPAGKLTPHEIISDRLALAVNADAPLADGYSLVTGAYLPDGRRLAPDFTEIAAPAVIPSPSAPSTLHPSLLPNLIAGYDYDLSIPDSPRLYLHWRLDGQSHNLTLADSTGAFTQPIALPPLTGYITTSHDLPPGWQTTTLTADGFSFRIPHSAFRITDRRLSFGPLTLVGAAITKESDGSYRVDLDWMANEPIINDHIVKVDLVGENYSWRDQSDSVPAGGAIPTLKWIPGILIHDRHRLRMLQPTLAAFQLAVYDHFTQRNLPLLDSRLALLGPTVPLGVVQP